MVSAKISHLCKRIFPVYVSCRIRLRLLFRFSLRLHCVPQPIFYTYGILHPTILVLLFLFFNLTSSLASGCRGQPGGVARMERKGGGRGSCKEKKREGMSGAKEDPHWGLIMYREVRRRNRFRMVYKEDHLSNGFSQSFQGDPPKLNLSA